jgi:general secretion pathway protein M
MIPFWAARTPREQMLILLLGLVSATYLLITALWLPLQRHRATVLDDIARYGRVAATLSAMPAGLAPLPASDAPLPSIITDTAATFQLTIRRLQPTDTTADITLDDAPFDAVLLWLDALERDHGLRIVTLSLLRRPEPGLVAATLIVGR